MKNYLLKFNVFGFLITVFILDICINAKLKKTKKIDITFNYKVLILGVSIVLVGVEHCCILHLEWSTPGYLIQILFLFFAD